MEDEVFAGNFRRQLAVQHELDGGRHLEPCHAGSHAGGHIGGADAGGECAQCAVGAGVAVGADDAVTGCHDAFFGQQSVLDAHLAHIVEIEDVVLVGELAALLGLGRALDVLVGNEVVEDDGDVLFVEHAVEARLFELVDGDGTMSSMALMSWPALTSARPACAARIFCVWVIPMMVLSFYRILFSMVSLSSVQPLSRLRRQLP